MAHRGSSSSSSGSSIRDGNEDSYVIGDGPYVGEALSPIPYHFSSITKGDQDLVASAFGVVVATWVDGSNDTLVRVMEVRGVSTDKRNWVIAIFGTDNHIPGDLSINLSNPLKQLGCTYYIDTDIKPLSKATNSYGNLYSSAICIRVPRSDYHKDVEEMQERERRARFKNLVQKKGAVFGKFADRPSTLSRTKQVDEDSDDEDLYVSSSNRSDILARRRVGQNDAFKPSRGQKMTTAERFVDNMGALHRAPSANADKPLTVANTRSFGERVRDFFLRIDPNKV